MRLLLVIVQAEDADLLVSRLVDRGLRVTRIDSVGSFLVRGNATVLIGLDEERVEEVLTTIRATCRTRTSYVSAVPTVEAPGMSFVVTMPLEVQVGGAVVFDFPVKQFCRLLGGGALPAADQHQPALECADCERSMAEGGSRMNLVLAILQNEDADTVANGLLAANHRVTRLNTAGGFFRRGNVTLLIGVDAEKVEDVLRIMQTNLPVRTEARPTEAGMPAYSATVFVLEADRFIRM
jgi:uncharacterized protein YaaQ